MDEMYSYVVNTQISEYRIGYTFPIVFIAIIIFIIVKKKCHTFISRFISLHFIPNVRLYCIDEFLYIMAEAEADR